MRYNNVSLCLFLLTERVSHAFDINKIFHLYFAVSVSKINFSDKTKTHKCNLTVSSNFSTKLLFLNY